MLSKRVDKWVKQWKSEGYEDGKAEGKVEGIIEGTVKGKQAGEIETKVNLLRLMLQERFGELPSWVDEKILNANAATLQRWILNVHKVDQLDKLLH